MTTANRWVRGQAPAFVGLRGACGAVVSVSLLLLPGCGGEKGTRHQITGTVTYQGKPIEHGTIAFEPDATVGANFAPSSYAHIKDGKYTTVRAESPTTGQYRVRVSALDRARMKTNVPPGEIVEPVALFPAYLTTVQIPPPNGKLDIDVPAGRTPGAGK